MVPVVMAVVMMMVVARRAVMAMTLTRVVVAVGRTIVAATAVVIAGRPDMSMAAGQRSDRQPRRDQKRHEPGESGEEWF